MATVLLTVQSLKYPNLPPFKIVDETGFLRDVQALLFNLCVLVLLPKLGAQDRNEALLLRNALHMHTVVVWDDEPTEQAQLRSVLLASNGHQKEALAWAWRALETTPPSAHDYMTKAQAVWMRIVDTQGTRAAIPFLLSLSRSAPPEYLPEIMEMAEQTWSFEEP